MVLQNVDLICWISQRLIWSIGRPNLHEIYWVTQKMTDWIGVSMRNVLCIFGKPEPYIRVEILYCHNIVTYQLSLDIFRTLGSPWHAACHLFSAVEWEMGLNGYKPYCSNIYQFIVTIIWLWNLPVFSRNFKIYFHGLLKLNRFGQ